jgi:hypothetical protein
MIYFTFNIAASSDEQDNIDWCDSIDHKNMACPLNDLIEIPEAQKIEYTKECKEVYGQSYDDRYYEDCGP